MLQCWHEFELCHFFAKMEAIVRVFGSVPVELFTRGSNRNDYNTYHGKEVRYI